MFNILLHLGFTGVRTRLYNPHRWLSPGVDQLGCSSESETSIRTAPTRMWSLLWTCPSTLDSGLSHVRRKNTVVDSQTQRHNPRHICPDSPHHICPDSLHHICPDDLAGDINPALDQLASAGTGYGGSDGTKCVVSRTWDRTNPLIYGACPSDAKPVCKKRIGRWKEYQIILILWNQLKELAIWVCSSRKISSMRWKAWEMIKPWSWNTNRWCQWVTFFTNDPWPLDLLFRAPVHFLPLGLDLILRAYNSFFRRRSL